MPPLASANLPVCLSTAPVNDPFSCPNRMDSTSVSGSAPQLTMTNGLPRRSEPPWIARAINSLPTPDSPSISTGMFDLAARSASRMVRAIDLARVTMSRKLSSPALRRVARLSSSSSASTRSALRIDTCRRSAPTGLTTKSVAPARMAEITTSIEPCAVWTIAGTAISRWRIRDNTPMPSRSGMTRSRIRRLIGGLSLASSRESAASPDSTLSAS